MPDTGFKPRRWTVIASGLLCGVLALVVVFTDRSAFSSPLAVMVVAAIGAVAVMLQLRFRHRDHSADGHGPLWLNVLGIVFALAALFGDRLRFGNQVGQLTALGAVGCFAISSAVILHSFRREKAAIKSDSD